MHQNQHMRVINRQHLILKRNSATIHVVGGNTIVAEHQTQGVAGFRYQTLTKDRIRDLAFQHRCTLQARNFAISDQLFDRTASVNGHAMVGDEVSNLLVIKHGRKQTWLLGSDYGAFSDLSITKLRRGLLAAVASEDNLKRLSEASCSPNPTH